METFLCRVVRLQGLAEIVYCRPLPMFHHSDDWPHQRWSWPACSGRVRLAISSSAVAQTTMQFIFWNELSCYS